MAQEFAQVIPLEVVKPPALAVLVNFGVVAGRKPTRQELEDLGAVLRELVPTLTIIDQQRYEVGDESDILLEEVRIEVPEAALAITGADPSSLQTRVVEAATAWVTRCGDDPGEPATLTERIAHQAVVDMRGPDAK